VIIRIFEGGRVQKVIRMIDVGDAVHRVSRLTDIPSGGCRVRKKAAHI
jgi:ribosomal protein S11